MKCLHCNESQPDIYFTQVQAMEECYTGNDEEVAEIWECSECRGLIKVYFKINRTTKLVEE